MTSEELNKLRKEVKQLEQKVKEQEEIQQLKKAKKELEEKGTIKSTIKTKLKGLHQHLQEKGKQYREEKTEEGMFKKPQYGTGFGTNKEFYNQPFESPITKQIIKKKK